MSSCRIRDFPTTGGIGEGWDDCSEGFGGLRISEGDNGLL